MTPWCSLQYIVRNLKFTPKDIHSFTIQWETVSDLSKRLPIDFPQFKLCAVISHDLMTTVTLKIKYPPPYHIDIQKWQAQCRCPLIHDSYRCGQPLHALASRTAPIMKQLDHRRTSAHRRLFTVASQAVHLNHVTTIMTFPSFIKFRNLCIAPEQYIFHSNRCLRCCRRHWLSVTEIKILAFISAPHYDAYWNYFTLASSLFGHQSKCMCISVHSH